jgi:phosphoribosyl-ATP pyrophosphohydrolase
MTAFLNRLEATLAARAKADPATSYVAKLHAKGIEAILKKIGEESTETIIAGMSVDREAIVYEAADLLFHLMVLLSHRGLSINDVISELERREGVSGIEEKNARPT